MNKKNFLILILLALIVVFFLSQIFKKQEDFLEAETAKVKIGRGEFIVEIAHSLEEKKTGLSGREVLSKNQGMLFVYDKPEKPSFWMKGMLFSLDFIWINNREVVRIDTNIKPEAVQPPKNITPDQLVDMVLEFNAGTVEEHKIKVGDRIIFLD